MALLPSAPPGETSGLERRETGVMGVVDSPVALPSSEQSPELLLNFFFKRGNAS